MFAGFSDADFEAFAPNKWKSNVYNRERLEVKQRLLALGHAVQGGLVAADGSPLSLESSVEHPALWNHKQVEAQHVFFSRNEGARRELDAIIDRQKTMASFIEDPTPLRNHVFLAISLAHQALAVAVRLHPEARVDRQNLERKLDDHFEREKLIAMLHALDGAQVGVTPALTPTAALEEDALARIVAELGAGAPVAPLAPPRMFAVVCELKRAEALALGAGVTEWAHAHLGALLAIYQFIAWSRDNDFVSMRETLQKEKVSRRQRGVGKNDAVRIVRGMFSGQTGVVQEIDGKGGVRVLVGKLAVKLEVDDLAKV